MLSAIIVCLKILIILLYGYVFYTLMQAKKEDCTIRIRLDLLSDIEVCFVAGLSLVSIFSKISDTALNFTACLCGLSAILAFFQSRRLILAGEEKVYLRNRTYDQKKVISIRPEKLVFLRVNMKNRSENIYFPLTDHSALQKVQNHINMRGRKKSH